jgi:ComEC/Rec2-related protein
MKRWLMRKRYRRTTIILLGSMAFLLGLAIAHKQVAVGGNLVIGFGVVALMTMMYHNVLTALAIILFGTALGSWHGTAYLHELRPYHTLALQKVTFTATANIDAVYGKHSQLSFVARDIRFTYPQNLHVPGTIKVSGLGETMVYRGDRLRISGKLYPTRGASQATVSYAQLSRVGTTSSLVDTLRRKFAAGMQTALPEPLASFGLGLLVGQRNTLPAEVSQALLMVGLTHIIAVSGYNLTILLEAARRLLGSRSKVISLVVACALIGGFLLIAGTSASIVRAAVISGLGLAAWYYGRSIRPLLLIFLAAAITAYANPVYLWSDISWYLSFLAFFGILIIAPPLTKSLFRGKQPPMLGQIVVESLCAELMTIPLVLYIFGQVSLVGLIANMLVVALIPLAMLLSLVAGLSGMLIGNVAGWFAWPAQLLLTYMLDVVNLLARIPHIFQQNKYLSGVDIAGCYGVVGAVLLLAYNRGNKRNKFNVATIEEKVENNILIAGAGN